MRNGRVWTYAALLASVPLVGGCGSETDDLKDQLDAQNASARALAHPEGCATASACAAAPLGAKACGGPREYVIYCRTTTDEAKLLAALEAARQAEQRYNELTHAVSDCSLLLAPETFAIQEGKCVAGGQ
jgi:hypothetical protein